MLMEEGNAMDATVASLLCLGVVNFQNIGIGGGMVMVVAEKDPNGGEPKVTVIDARVVAPDSVSMGLAYEDNKDLALIGKLCSYEMWSSMRDWNQVMKWRSIYVPPLL